MELCASYLARDVSVKSDAPNFPLTGPVSFTVTMKKEDLPNGYKLEVKTIKVILMSEVANIANFIYFTCFA